jgi:hypothetical protein
MTSSMTSPQATTAMIAPVCWRISDPAPAPAAASSAEPMTVPPA